MSYDEMELDMIGDQRTALFIVISDTDDTFNFVVAMMYSQLFNLLCDRGTARSNHRREGDGAESGRQHLLRQ